MVLLSSISIRHFYRYRHRSARQYGIIWPVPLYFCYWTHLFFMSFIESDVVTIRPHMYRPRTFFPENDVPLNETVPTSPRSRIHERTKPYFNLESSQTWGFREQFWHYKPVSNQFCTFAQGGRGVKSVVEVTVNSKEETLKTVLPIRSKKSASGPKVRHFTRNHAILHHARIFCKEETLKTLSQ